MTGPKHRNFESSQAAEVPCPPSSLSFFPISLRSVAIPLLTPVRNSPWAEKCRAWWAPPPKRLQLPGGQETALPVLRPWSVAHIPQQQAKDQMVVELASRRQSGQALIRARALICFDPDSEGEKADRLCPGALKNHGSHRVVIRFQQPMPIVDSSGAEPALSTSRAEPIRFRQCETRSSRGLAGEDRAGG